MDNALPSGSGPEASKSQLRTWLDQAWQQEAEVRSVEVEGARVSYRAWGLDHTDKPGLILVHGILAHARWWDHVAPSFADRYRVVALDFTGMGDSARRPAYSRPQYARELAGVARHAGLRDVVLVAHSFGATPALYAALHYPDLFERVIAIDARVFREHNGKYLPSRQERLYASREEAVSRYRLIPPSEGLDPEILAYVAWHSVAPGADGWKWKFDPETIDPVDRWGMVEEMRFKPLAVDLIHGGESSFMTDENIANFLHHMPSCGDPVEIPLANHHIMLEQPVALIAAINGLLAKPHPKGISQ
ncbi:MAG TPA: alpha/beta hydrolase [Novosphingobium sp.]